MSATAPLQLDEKRLEREYAAAKRAYIAAQQRLSAAKAALKPILEAREAAKRAARLELEVAALEALRAGASERSAGAMMGRKYANPSQSYLEHTLLDATFPRGELMRDYYNAPWDQKDAIRERLVMLALERYHQRSSTS